MTSTSVSFAELPFPEQLALLDAHVAARDALPALLEVVARLPDHQPFAELVRRLFDAELLDDAELAGALATHLAQLPATGIQRLLRTLAEAPGDASARAPGDASVTRSAWERASVSQRERFISLVAETIPALSIDRVAAICLLDRWLKNEARAARDALARRAEEVVREAIDAGAETLAALRDATLLALPTGSLGALTAAATARGLGEVWRMRRQRFAAEVLAILEAQPKSLSQANAEELLARRVYTDPGHFFVELLQNADDAQARRWRVTLWKDRVEVWHDGIPFDAKDVVGVLSIGQTTKAADQIGLFGVGFKSVYEICERPQIFSPPFCFEIADVSLPRRLACRSFEEKGEGTHLVLPFRGGADAARGAALEAKALAVPPQTLLTLRAIRELIVEGPTMRRRVYAEEGGQDRVSLHIEEWPRAEGSPRDAISFGAPVVARTLRYLVARDTFPHPGRASEDTRRSPVELLVAIELDAAGKPRPLAPSTPTVFAFLPTGERSGLRVLLHAPFVLPVDRERLDPTVPKNRWALARAGELLAALVARWARAGETRRGREGSSVDARGGDGAGDEAPSPREAPLGAMLRVLPLAGELTHPGYEIFLDRLVASLQEVSFLPGAAGDALSPARAYLCEDDVLAEVLGEVPLDAEGGRALVPLPPRERSLAAAFGARSFDLLALVDFLEGRLADRADGVTPSPDEPWLNGGALDALLFALSRLVDASPLEGRADLIARLATLPLWPGVDGKIYRGSALARGPARLRALYGHRHVLLAAHLDPPDEGHVARLIEGLFPARLDDGRLLEDLGDAACAAALLHLDAGDDAHALMRDLLEALTNLSPADRRDPRISRARVFLGDDGHLHPLVGEDALRLGAGDALETWLRGVSRAVAGLHLCDARLQADYGGTLAELGAERLTLAGLLAGLREADGALASSLDREAWRGLHRLLLEGRSELTPRTAALLVKTPIFFDREGRRRPLEGADAALLPADAAIVALAPEAPWLEDDALLRSLAATLVSAQGALRVARTLTLAEDTAPLFDPLGAPATLRRAYRYLVDHLADLTSDTRRRLAAAPIWLDERDRLANLGELRRPDEADLPSRALVALYRAWEARPATFIDPEALALAEALEVAEAIPLADHAQWVRDLAASDLRALLLDTTHRPALWASLETAAARLSPRALAPLRDAAIFADEEGVLRPLGSWREVLSPGRGKATSGAPLDARAYLVAEPYRALLRLGGLPLVASAAARELAAVLRGLEEPPAALDEVLARLEDDPRLATPEAAARARACLIALVAAGGEETARLTERADRLSALTIWPGTDGALYRAAALVSSREAEAALGEAWEELLGDTPLLADEVRDEASLLSSFFSFRDPLAPLLGRLQGEARVGELLSAQPPFLQEPSRILEFLEIVARRADATAEELAEVSEGLGEVADPLFSLPLLIDAAGRLARAPLPRVTADEAALLVGTSLAGAHVDLAFAASASARIDAAIWERLAPRLPSRRLLVTLADHCREARPAQEVEVPPLSRPEVREGLYRVLLARREEIAADVQARGLLGRAALFVDRGGVLRAPRALLLISPRHTLAALEALEARPAEELPEALLQWIGETYAHEAHEVEGVLDHLLPIADEIVVARDVEGAVVFLETLAQLFLARSGAEGAEGTEGTPEDEVRLLREAIAALPTRIKLRRRLRVPCADAAWRRPRALVLATPQEAAFFLPLFADPPPIPAAALMASLHARALLEALGAQASLKDEHLQALLHEAAVRGPEEEGDDPASISEERERSLSRALVLLRALGEDPSRLRRLGLDQRAWLPDGEGRLRRPRDLYWPDAAARALLGDDLSLYPADEVRFQLPEALVVRLPFRRAAEARVEDVIEAICADPPASVDQLRWLEAGLASRRLDAVTLRAALATVSCLRDDLGETRPPQHLCRQDAAATLGRRRGDFGEGRRYRRVAAALGIPRRPGPRQAVAFLAEIAGLLRDDDAATRLLDEEPELLESLPRALGIWARRPPRTLPPRDEVALVGLRLADGETRLCLASDPRLTLAGESLGRPTSSGDMWGSLPPGDGREVSSVGAWTPFRRGAHVDAFGHRDDGLVPLWPSDATDAAKALLERLLTGRGEERVHTPSAPGRSVDAEATEATRRERGTDVSLGAHDVRGGGALRREAQVVDPPVDGPADADADADAGEKSGLVARLRRWWRGAPTPLMEGSSTSSSPPSGEELTRQGAETRAERRRRERAERRRERERERERKALQDAHEHEARRALRRASAPPSSEGSSSPRPEDELYPLGGLTGGAARRGGRGRSSPGEAPREERAWFRPPEGIDEQLSDHSASLRDRGRSPTLGFSHAPRLLSAPWLYAPQIISGRFDEVAQRWLPLSLPAALFSGGDARIVGEVVVRGRVPAGEVLLPLPAFSRVTSVEGEEGALHQRPTTDGRMHLFVARAQEIAYRVALERAPSFDVESSRHGAPPSRALLASTTHEDDLPGEVLDVVDEARADLTARRRAPLEVALALRDLIRERYRYDPTYLEDPRVARWLRSLVLGRKNMHIAALHAGRDARHLGRGVCYELNALLCELLRRAGIPAAVAKGWTFDRGTLVEPDHLWALALLPTPVGLRFLPLDASSTRKGRPLHALRRPPGRWQRPKGGRAPRAPSWERGGERHEAGASPTTRGGERHETGASPATRGGERHEAGASPTRGGERHEARGGSRRGAERSSRERRRHDVAPAALDAEKLAGLIHLLGEGSEDDPSARLARARQLLADPSFVAALKRLLF